MLRGELSSVDVAGKEHSLMMMMTSISREEEL